MHDAFRFRNINEIRRLLSEGTVVNGSFSPGEDYRKKLEVIEKRANLKLKEQEEQIAAMQAKLQVR